AIRIGGKEPGRSLIEIVDDILEMSEGVFLLDAVGGDVLVPPQRMARCALALDGRDADPDPYRLIGLGAGGGGPGIEAYLFDGSAPFAHRLRQPVDMLGY